MRVSGTQSAISEFLSILDNSFISPFICHCNSRTCHTLICPYLLNDAYYICEIQYDGNKIINLSVLHKRSVNLLDGSVK